MSTKQPISRLEELLARVQMRAAEPRTNGGARPVHVAPAAAPAPAVAPAVAAAYAEPELEEVITYSEPTPAPAPVEMLAAEPAEMLAAEPAAEQEYADNYDDVEVSSEVVEVDIDIDEPMPLESGAQPVAHSTMPPEDLLEELEEVEEEAQEAAMPTQPSAPPFAEEREQVLTAPANEIEEPAPSSSRRPIASEAPAAEVYDEGEGLESAPRHTPPPESGKQVAAAPSNVPPAHKTSAPPPSLEDRTLVGGWREPGLGAAHLAPAPIGARVSPPVTPVTVEPSAAVLALPAVVQAAPAQAQAPRMPLSADVTRPDLSAPANVASFQGAPPVARPTTLGELLDMTLGL